MNVELKIAIFKSGKSQRRLSIEGPIPEGKISDFVTGRAWPTAAERARLAELLGVDCFQGDPAEFGHAEARSRR